MRIWSIHPKYLDSKGLVALWRETLLAQKVLAGATKGYKFHPQLTRFREMTKPLDSIGVYLSAVASEAEKRGYRFDRSKILNPKSRAIQKIPVSSGQLEYETSHLMLKLKRRDPDAFEILKKSKIISPHPLFRVIRGKIHSWEKTEAKEAKR